MLSNNFKELIKKKGLTNYGLGIPAVQNEDIDLNDLKNVVIYQFRIGLCQVVVKN